MKTKKLIIGVIISIFIFIVLFSVYSVFDIKKIDLTFNAFEDSNYYQEVKQKTDKFIGSNMLFFDEEELKKDIEENPYLYVSIEKKLPYSVSCTVNERREVFVLDYNGEKITLSGDGYVLSGNPKTTDDRYYINLVLDGISICDYTLGKKIKTDCDSDFYLALELAQSVDLSDCIDKMTITKNVAQSNLLFLTYTDVSIDVPKFTEYGALKVKAGFDCYSNEANDYIKTYNSISVYVVESGTEKSIQVQWINPIKN